VTQTREELWLPYDKWRLQTQHPHYRRRADSTRKSESGPGLESVKAPGIDWDSMAVSEVSPSWWLQIVQYAH
jgi:hypothetical protein